MDIERIVEGSLKNWLVGLLIVLGVSVAAFVFTPAPPDSIVTLDDAGDTIATIAGTICGILCGSMANPMALGYASDTTKGDAASISYASVYPLGMFLRVVIAQILVMCLV